MSAGFSYEGNTPEMQELKRKTDGKPTTQEVVGALAKTPLLFEPGTRFKYSFCHDVLGAVLEAVCGDTLGNILQKEVFEPLGMEDTGFSIDEERKSRLAPEYYNFNGSTNSAELVIYREGVNMDWESAL